MASARVARSKARATTHRSSARARVIGALLILDGLAVLALWAASLAGGAFGGLDGLFVYQEGNFPVLHVAAELLMAALAIAGGVGLFRRRPWGRGLGLLALGMLGYSAINSAGWPMQHDPTLLLPMAATLLLVVIAAPALLRDAWHPRRARMEGG